MIHLINKDADVAFTTAWWERTIKELLSKVLPDEQFHRETLKRIAGNDLLELMAEKHHRAVAELRGNK